VVHVQVISTPVELLCQTDPKVEIGARVLLRLLRLPNSLKAALTLRLPRCATVWAPWKLICMTSPLLLPMNRPGIHGPCSTTREGAVLHLHIDSVDRLMSLLTSLKARRLEQGIRCFYCPSDTASSGGPPLSVLKEHPYYPA
jgi:hypothetical protein